MNPQAKDSLIKYTTAAKEIIYDAQRMKKFMQMMGTKEGAVLAVHTVLMAIEKVKPVPKELETLLAINIYVLMVDMAQQATGLKGDDGIMQEVMGMLSKGAASQPQAGDEPQQPQQQQAPQQPAPQGLIGSQMGVPA